MSREHTTCTTADYITRCSCQAGQMCTICDPNSNPPSPPERPGWSAVAMSDLLDCGHRPTPQPPGPGGTGVALRPDGKTSCYDCADIVARTAMATADKVYGYLSSDGKSISTWSGGKLADITGSTVRRVGFRHGSGKRTERTYFTATDASGKRWCGQSPGPGMTATMRGVRRTEGK